MISSEMMTVWATIITAVNVAIVFAPRYIEHRKRKLEAIPGCTHPEVRFEELGSFDYGEATLATGYCTTCGKTIKEHFDIPYPGGYQTSYASIEEKAWAKVDQRLPLMGWTKVPDSEHDWYRP